MSLLGLISRMSNTDIIYAHKHVLKIHMYSVSNNKETTFYVCQLNIRMVMLLASKIFVILQLSIQSNFLQHSIAISGSDILQREWTKHNRHSITAAAVKNYAHG